MSTKTKSLLFKNHGNQPLHSDFSPSAALIRVLVDVAITLLFDILALLEVCKS